MSSMPYNSKAYLDAKVSMTNHGTVDAGRQIQSPASAGSRGLAKTTQFSKDKTQMQLGQEAIAESMVDIRNIMNRIDGINVPTNEMNELADDEKMEFTKILLDISVIKDRVQALSVDEDAKASAIQSLTSAEESLVALDESAVQEKQSPYTTDKEGAGWIMANKDKIITQLYAGGIQSVLDPKDAVKAISDLIPDVTEKQIIDIIKKDDAFAGETAVREDSDFDAEAWSTGKVEDHGPDLMRLAKGQPIDIPAWDSYYMDMDDGRPMDGEDNEAADDSIGGQVTSAIRGHMADIEKAGFVGDTLKFKPTADTIKYAQNIIKSPEFKKAYQSTESVSEDEDELGRLKELAGIEEDTNDDLMQWAKKYSQYKNLEDDNLIEALYDFAFDLGITQFIFEVGELQAAEQKLGKKQEDWEDAEINAAMEMSPISNGLIDDLHRILPGNAELEQKLDSIRGMLEKAGLKEDKYQPMPEGDEFDIAEDEDFEEVLGSLGFPEDETELFDAEYQGRKVPLNKPMRGDSKKFKVYVKDPKTGNVKKVNFGHGGTSAKKAWTEDHEDQEDQIQKQGRVSEQGTTVRTQDLKTKARYWSCRKW